MRAAPIAVIGAVLVTLVAPSIPAQSGAKRLAAVFAHPDDEGSVAPVLAKYAREGAQVYLVIATDGAAGGRQTSIPVGPELARARAEEARCAAGALGIQPPVLLEFPDGKLGAYAEDSARLFAVTQRIQGELQRLKPDALLTWGPDGGTGHPDHRLVSAIVTQLVRTGAPGVPDRLFYASLPADVMKVMSAGRGAPPLLIPDAKYLTMRVPFTPADAEAARRSMACHKTQFPPEAVEQVTQAATRAWAGALGLAPASGGPGGTDLFRAP
jgi:LmbE family N-acetylglucosaminyl deacetylase